MNIRPAAHADAATIADFNLRMALETEQRRLDPATVCAGVTALLNDPAKGIYYVAEQPVEGLLKLAGQLLITYEWSDWRNAWFWWIQSVYIRPEVRGQRIYAQLYDFVKAKAAESGNVCGFRLYVENDNSRAQRVYERVGMEASHYLMYEEELSEPPALAGGQLDD